MAEKGVTATFVVQYKSADSTNKIIAEIDDAIHTDTSFYPGTQVHFRIYANCPFELFLSDKNSSVTNTGSGTKSVQDEEITFVQTESASLQYIYNGGWNFSWHGNSGISVPTVPINNKTGVFLNTSITDNQIVAVGKANYNSNYVKRRLNPSQSYDGFSVIILIREV